MDTLALLAELREPQEPPPQDLEPLLELSVEGMKQAHLAADQPRERSP